ncbi:inositol monophosphatase family protein [Schaalia sp. ZJ1691]|uniref:inositol monophosphatase family protein n=1 Tax=Schaalia sp. ZJ1691 TaxID=2709404 RepID=UPI0013EB7178|nr:inositol monophosphatase family protein [Schaalia sp. ZJ1691]
MKPTDAPNSQPLSVSIPSPSALPSSIPQALALIAGKMAQSCGSFLIPASSCVTDVATKANLHDPVTIYDRQLESALRHLCGSIIPGCRILGEEHGESVLVPIQNATQSQTPQEHSPFPQGFTCEFYEPHLAEATRLVSGLGSRVRWIVDPIDGTSNFAAGLPWFNTSIAAELDGTIVAGAICAPLLGELFVADDTQAWCEGPSGRQELTGTGPSSEIEAVLIDYYPRFAFLRDDPVAAAAYEVRLADAYQSIRRFGACALDLAYIAAGRCGAMIGTAFGPWDVAAGLHLVKVSGGFVLNLDFGQQLPDGLRAGVVAACRGLTPTTAIEVLLEAHSRALANE